MECVQMLDTWAKTILHDGPRNVAAGLFLAGLAINFANIVGRYIFLRPIMAAEEVLVYLMIWCIFLGAVLVTYQGSHLKMDLFTMHLPRRAQNVLNAITGIVFLAISAVIIHASAEIVSMVAGMDEISVVARIPMEVPYAALPVSFALIACGVLWRLFALFRDLRPNG